MIASCAGLEAKKVMNGIFLSTNGCSWVQGFAA